MVNSTQRIRELNDELRQNLHGGLAVDPHRAGHFDLRRRAT